MLMPLLLPPRFVFAFAALSFSLLGFATGAQASVVVAEYGFFVSASPGTSNQTPSPSSDADPLTTASDAVWGSTLSGAFVHSSSGVGLLLENKASVVTATTNDNTLSTALTQNRYLGFSVTNNTGNILTLDELTFDHQFVNGHPTISASIAILARVGGGSFVAGDLVDTVFVNFPGATDGDDFDYGVRTIDMSALSVANGSSVEVRLYYYDSSTSNSRSNVIDNLTLTAIPEPGAAGLLSVVGLGLLAFRRRGRS